ncbi:MAG: AMP-binding protein, partial [Firmicutes bacterium]|nr:AMP-binding protein [Bacillota bacterium]
DEEDRLVPDGETGEICVRSSSLSYGYYKDPERTAEVFMQNPLQTAFEEKIFRTGDLAYKNDRGELEFVGRKDLQVKFMGHRIELGEIEAAALTVPGVLENACAYDPDAKKIVLFFTGNVEGKELRKALSGKLPDYMVPRKFIPLESMPRNAHDKVDRVRLKAMAKEMSGKK